jgi:hypothetical protein
LPVKDALGAGRRPKWLFGMELRYLVLLAHCELTRDDVQQELAWRFGVCGLEEKARRGQPE